MKAKWMGLVLAALLAAVPLAMAQDSTSTEKQSTGTDVKDAAKTAGKDTEKGTKVAVKDTEKGTKIGAKHTEKAAKKTGSTMKKGVHDLTHKKSDDKTAETKPADTAN